MVARSFFRTLALLPVALLLWSCTNVPLTSIPKLQSIDLKTTNLSELGAVVKIPDAIDVSKLEIVYTVDIRAGAQKESVSANLRPVEPDAQARALISKEAEAGYEMQAYRLSQGDIAKVEALREKGIQWKAEYGESKGGVGIHVSGACVKPDFEAPRMRGWLWIKTEETVDYILFLRRLDLSPSPENLGEVALEEIICKAETR